MTIAKKSLTPSATSVSILISEINDRVNTCPDYKRGRRWWKGNKITKSNQKLWLNGPWPMQKLHRCLIMAVCPQLASPHPYRMCLVMTAKHLDYLFTGGQLSHGHFNLQVSVLFTLVTTQNGRVEKHTW